MDNGRLHQKLQDGKMVPCAGSLNDDFTVDGTYIMTLGVVLRWFSKVSAPLPYRATRALGRGGRVWDPVRGSALRLRLRGPEEDRELLASWLMEW